MCACPINDDDVPIVLIHGFIADQTVFDQLIENIKRDFPNRKVYAPKILFGYFSSIFCGFTRYVRVVATAISKISNNAECIDLVGHSQGGLVSRAYIQLYSGTKKYPIVRNFISLAGAQGGFYCGSNCPDFLQNGAVRFAQKHMYSNFFQARATPAGYWRDPYQFNTYAEQCGILAQINGECPKQHFAIGKSKILSLNKFYVMYSQIDEVLLPSSSGNFGTYEPYSGNVIELDQNALYLEDRIGIRELKTAGKLIQCRTDVWHQDFVENEEYYENYLRRVLNGDVFECE
ncbi:Palmitoyl-protein_thioesterase [Hexamita inflata]|uniref:Palmitoyl-protein_thioesterase n=1 Tax=Hexamita inflata TaxID=28002 RepID=A0ABP1H9X6_9EUKA